MRISTVINGWTALVYALPFDGHTGFADANHARNFVRYLFSQSKAHQPSEDTALNFCIEQQDGLWLKGTLNTDPAGLLAQFLSRRFPSRDAHRLWKNDGFYPLFAIRTPKGTAVSNFLRADPESPLFVDHPLMDHLGIIDGLTSAQVQSDIIAFWGGKDAVVDFETGGLDTAQLGAVESILHKALSLDDPSVVLSVSHRDQPETNPVFHVHRIRTI